MSTTTSDISPQWLYTHLGDDFFEGARIVDLNSENIGEGQGFAGIVMRVRLEYDCETTAPSSLIVKLPTTDPTMRELLINHESFYREARFYRDLAPSLSVPIPRCYCAHIDETGEDYALILEDLGNIANEGAEFASVEEVMMVLRAVAPFHAQFWNDPVARSPWLIPITDSGDRETVLQRIVDGIGVIEVHLGPSCLLDCAREIERHFPKMPARFPVLKPFTVIHGDLHWNNAARLDSGICLYDWQVVSRGTPDMDITNLMLSSLSVDDLMAHQERCFQAYHEALLAAGVSKYKYKKFRKDCERAMMLNILKFVAILGSIDMNVPGGPELIDRVLTTLNLVAERTGALKFYKRLPVLFLMMRAMNLIYR